MKNLLLLLILFLSTFSNSIAQTSVPEKSYIHLYTDSVIYGEKVSYNTGFMIEPHITVDETKYRLDEVKFYNDGFGLKGNVMQATHGKALFANILSKGNLNIFQSSQNSVELTGGTEITGIEKSKLLRNYYNKDTDPLKKINYNNLIIDISDNAESLQALEKAHTYKIQERRLTTIGTVACLIVYLTYSFPSEFEITSNKIPISAIIFGAFSYYKALKKAKLKNEYYERTFEIYNRDEESLHLPNNISCSTETDSKAIILLI